MRRAAPLVLAAAIAACGGRSVRRTTPTTLHPVAANPASDLAGGRPGAGARAGAPDRRAGTGDTARPVTDLETIKLQVVGHTAAGDPEVEAVAPGALLEAGNEALKAGHQDEALAQYRRLVSEFPSSRLAPVALYNIALVYEARGDLAGAIAAYRELVTTYPTGPTSVEAHLRIAALQAEHQQWPAAAATLAEVLARTDLTHADRVEAFARLGYVQLESGQLDAAEASLGKAIDVWRRAQHIDDPYYIAMAHYYLGEIAHRRFKAAPLRLPDDQLKRDIDAKEALAVHAYDRWKEALAFDNPYWATASGYQMSQIFYELWQSAVTAPFPQGLATAARDYYVAEVHRLVAGDLTKALDGHRMNVKLAQAYGVETTWSQASKERAAEILGVLAREAGGAGAPSAATAASTGP